MLDLEFDAKETILHLHYCLDAFALQLGWHSSVQEESYCHAAVPVH